MARPSSLPDLILSMRAGTSRREFLSIVSRLGKWGIAASVIGTGLGPLKTWADSVPPDGIRVLGYRPLHTETRPERLIEYITPIELLFNRTHFPPPTVDPREFYLSVSGEVHRPVRLSLTDLDTFPKVELTAVLECAGNGRGLFDPRVPGRQWTKGAVGNVTWTGVRLADVVRKTGVKESGKVFVFNGADLPYFPTGDDFRKSLPREKALHPDTLLATQLNGRPIPRNHGGPLRLIVPGWTGTYWVKWVNEIFIQPEPFLGKFQAEGYRVPIKPITPGSDLILKESKPVTINEVKSLITSPVNGAAVPFGQPLAVKGYAWTGETKIRKVEVSTDNGRVWSDTQLVTPDIPYAWRGFAFEAIPRREGPLIIRTRAHDTSGRAQPMTALWNPLGYLYNAADRVIVRVVPPERVSG